MIATVVFQRILLSINSQDSNDSLRGTTNAAPCVRQKKNVMIDSRNDDATNNNCNATTAIRENAREEMNGSNNVSEHTNDNDHTVMIPFLEDTVRNDSTKVNNITLKNTSNYCSSLNFIRKDYQ